MLTNMALTIKTIKEIHQTLNAGGGMNLVMLNY